MDRTWWRALPLLILFASGCLTPKMGRDLEVSLGLDAPPPPAPRVRALSSSSLPDRIWYADLEAGVYHERRTNTFIAWDGDRRCWIAVPERRAFRTFRPERARLLIQGAPEDVEKVLDYVIELEPTWRGL